MQWHTFYSLISSGSSSVSSPLDSERISVVSSSMSISVYLSTSTLHQPNFPHTSSSQAWRSSFSHPGPQTLLLREVSNFMLGIGAMLCNYLDACDIQYSNLFNVFNSWIYISLTSPTPTFTNCNPTFKCATIKLYLWTQH